MSNITVPAERIAHLMATAEYQVFTVFDKCTIVAAKLENGFVLVEGSACVDPANYDEKLGKEICMERIRNKLWELEGYALQRSVYDGTAEEIAKQVGIVLNDAIEEMEKRLRSM